MKKRGIFIVFEGVDGSGKTTQLNILKNRLDEYGIDSVCDKEPTDGVIGRIIRSAMAHEIKLEEETLALLFAADRLEHIKNLLTTLESGITVLCDRYVFSSLAYQGAALPIETIIEYNKTAIDALMPDIVVFLEASPEACSRRIRHNRGVRELFENPERAFEVKKCYDKVFGMFSEKTSVRLIDGGGNAAEVSERVWNTVKPLFDS